MFIGKDLIGCFIVMEIILNGIMLNINVEVVVNMNFFKEIYRWEDCGRVELDGVVIFEVNG